MLKFGVKGKVVQGKYPNGEILIEDDTKNTGGYYLYIWPRDGSKYPNTDKEVGYDLWFEDVVGLESQFNHYNWQIEWLE